MPQNIEYKSSEIKDFYSTQRTAWKQFYPSERKVFERTLEGFGADAKVLDVGCAAGGLGRALHQRFQISDYTGIDINKEVIEFAKSAPFPDGLNARFEHGDIISDDCEIGKSQYDATIALGCADWNLHPEAIVNSCWNLVKPGGQLIISLRLTPEAGVNDISRSYQYINFSEDKDVSSKEIANYVILNIAQALKIIEKLQPSEVYGYGYWGSPSTTAVTLYDQIVFGVFSISKPIAENTSSASCLLELPLDLFTRTDS